MTVLRVVVVAACLLFSASVFAQETVAPTPIDQVVKALQARIAQLEQKNEPTPKQRAKDIRKALQAQCENRGLKFQEAQVNAKTGELVIVCR